jgi:hypothetical protein
VPAWSFRKLWPGRARQVVQKTQGAKGVVPFFDGLVGERRDPQPLERRFRLGLFKDLPEDELALSPRIACIDDLCNAPTVKGLGKRMSYHRRTS